jgi:Lipase (class 3)
MSFSEEQVMLTLAALAYRGFEEGLPSSIHETAVRKALIQGLSTFEPVRDEWELVWGPATMHDVPILPALNIFDWNAMYVVRNRTYRNKYAIAIRGTNPIAWQDWLFGDLWVSSVVRWPYGNGTEAISTSTALSLTSLQSMHARPQPSATTSANGITDEVRNAFYAIAVPVGNTLTNLSRTLHLDRWVQVEQRVSTIVQEWIARGVCNNRRSGFEDALSAVLIKPEQLRPKLQPKTQPNGKLDLLTFLRAQSENTSQPLEVTVTGHSKGGALAPVVALWLKEALASDQAECWDEKRNAHVRCYAFAGPTPGNAAFADRIDAVLGQDCQQFINTNDVVPHAFAAADLAQIPALYGKRTEALAPIVDNLIRTLNPIAYRHPAKAVKTFAGTLDSSRSFAVELVYQHLDAYLSELNLLTNEMNALTSFI